MKLKMSVLANQPTVFGEELAWRERCVGVGGSMAVAVGVAVALAVGVALAMAVNIALAVDFLVFVAPICTYREIDWFPNYGIFYFQ